MKLRAPVWASVTTRDQSGSETITIDMSEGHISVEKGSRAEADFALPYADFVTFVLAVSSAGGGRDMAMIIRTDVDITYTANNKTVALNYKAGDAVQASVMDLVKCMSDLAAPARRALTRQGPQADREL